MRLSLRAVTMTISLGPGHAHLDGRRASRKASQASTSEAKSVSMCPASARSASEPETRPPATSASMKGPVSPAATVMARSLERRVSGTS
jgi:hypothetical protein